MEGRGKNVVGTLYYLDYIPPAYVGGQRGFFGLTWDRDRNVPDVINGPDVILALPHPPDLSCYVKCLNHA